MSLELTILRLFKHRQKYDRYVRAVPKQVLDPKTQAILADFGAYFKEFPDVATIPEAEFLLWFLGFRHPTLNEEQRSLYTQLLHQAQTDVDPNVEGGLMERLAAARAASEIQDLLDKWDAGEEVDLMPAVRDTVENFELELNRKVKMPWVTTSIDELLLDEANDTGLHWRLECLNASMRPLRGGDFVVVAARPDKGKTTFMTDQLTYFAPQVQQLYNGERSILWMNNEGPGKRIIQRMYQSALHATIPDMLELQKQPATDKRYKHLLAQRYAEAMGGNPDMIRVFDIHDFWSHEVEDIIRRVPPGLIVFDMVDNIKFGGTALNGGERTDQLLEAMYQWARIQSVKWDVPILATSQISADGDGLAYPTLSMLKDSKTGKQGAAEAIITLGASNDPTLGGIRYIGSTKNKLHRFGGPKDPRCEVIFDSERGRYLMPRSM